MTFSGRVAIVTGGSQGFGAGIAEAFRTQGAEVWITGRRAEPLAATAKRLGCHPFCGDVANPDDWDQLVERVVERHGRIDFLINNAGAGVQIAPLVEQSVASIEQSIAINLTGAILGCRRVAPLLQAQGSGTIVNISSVCATHAWPGWSVYSASKAGLVQFARCLDTELRSHGVRVTTVIPSWGATEFNPASQLAEFSAGTAAKCIQPQDLGALVAQICALPAHLIVQELTLWPQVQEVVPL